MSDEKTGKKKGHVSLSATLPTAHRCVPAKDHPLKARVFEIGQNKPTPTLEVWFDGGLIRDREAEEKMAVATKKLAAEGIGDELDKNFGVAGCSGKPTAYHGCDDENPLLECKHNGIMVWPIRFDLADEGWQMAESQRPWTLYHYTHEQSFVEFVRVFGRQALPANARHHNEHSHHMEDIDPHDPEEVRRLMINLLCQDYQERTPLPTGSNPNSEPELSLLEPQFFESKEKVVVGLHGKADLNSYSLTSGTRFGNFGDYCISFLVPQSCCFNLPSENPDQSSLVKISKDSLESLRKRAAHAHVQHQIKVREEQKKTGGGGAGGHQAGGPKGYNMKRQKGCLGFLCGSMRASDDMGDDEDEDDLGDKDAKKAHVKRKEMDQWKKKIHIEWLKEHFLSVSKRKEQDAKRREQQLSLEIQDRERQRREGEVKKKKGPVFVVVRNGGMESVDNSWDLFERAAGYLGGNQKAEIVEENNEHMVMFAQHKIKESEDKEVQDVAQGKIKERKKVETKKHKPKGSS